MQQKTSIKGVLILIMAILLLPQYCYGFSMLNAQIQLRAEIISFLNLALFITALISIKQFFWPGDNNTMPFHYFNIIFTILFYLVGLPFLISNRHYYEEYAQLTPMSVMGKFFLSINISSFAQWVIVASVFINVLYIKRYRRDYYEAGIARHEVDKTENTPHATGHTTDTHSDTGTDHHDHTA